MNALGEKLKEPSIGNMKMQWYFLPIYISYINCIVSIYGSNHVSLFAFTVRWKIYISYVVSIYGTNHVSPYGRVDFTFAFTVRWKIYILLIALYLSTVRTMFHRTDVLISLSLLPNTYLDTRTVKRGFPHSPIHRTVKSWRNLRHTATWKCNGVFYLPTYRTYVAHVCAQTDGS